MANKNEPHEYTKNPHFAGGLVKPFIAGARVQLERYLEAQRLVSTHNMTGFYLDRCLYELSSLVEHLSTVATYLKHANIDLPIHNTINDVRNHIRHDARGEIDQRSDKRAKRLGLNEKLQVGITFADNGVKIGTTELKADQISQYLDTAEMIAYALLMGSKIETDGNNVAVNAPKKKG